MKKRRASPTGPMTSKEAAYLRAHAATLSRAAMSAHLGWSERLLGKRLSVLGLTWIKGARPWTIEDDEMLRALAGTMTIRAISERMNRDFDTLQQKAQRLGISLSFNRWWSKDADAQLRVLVAAGRTRHEIAETLNVGYELLLRHLKSLGLDPKHERRERATPRPSRAKKAPRAPRPKVECAPRERAGIPQIRRTHIIGSVAWCDRCHAPVVDTPQAWADHNLRVHVQPIRRIA